jgi:tetratricopeptide (TPR) repeat protein
MSKILKSSTRVPAHLYVKRNADNQILKIIREMLRPGYVSVARQMGKTNLLQNAKRELNDDKYHTIYIDLSSSKFESSRQYFHYIVDTIIEVNYDILRSAAAIIGERRKNSSVSAAVEHDRELRAILKSLPGNLVIILDEVDALAKASFSDEIFAQIRSTYFMRETHEILERLTYILSGVIEPTKLIKNKENSPFNIAEQIYLDDFSYDEFTEFIDNSKLDINDSLRDEIYSWTNGNPRITFEICSALEDISIVGGKIQFSDIESTVNQIYLNNFDAAPIDHIRDLVTNNALLRDAIINVRKNISITDELQNQLYLYGILESKTKSISPKIKNKIIDLSLSNEWLSDLATKTIGFYEYGIKQIAEGNYTEGIEFILRHAEGTTLSDVQRSAAYLTIADAYNKSGNYEESNSYINKASFDKRKRPSDYYYSRFQFAINCYLLGLYNDAVKSLDEIIEGELYDSVYYNALITKANYALAKDYDANYDYALQTYQDTISSIITNPIPEEQRNMIISFCHFRLAQLSFDKQDLEKAYASFEASLPHSPVQVLPAIYTGLIQTSPGKPSKNNIEGLISAVKCKELFINSTFTPLNLTFSEGDLFTVMLSIFEYAYNDFEDVLNYSIKHFYANTKSAVSIIFSIAYRALGSQNRSESVRQLLLHCIDNSDSTDYYKARCYAGLSYIDMQDDNYDYLIYASKSLDYSNKTELNSNVDHLDIACYMSAASGFYGLELYEYAEEFIDYLLNCLNEADELVIAGDMIGFYYLKALISVKRKSNNSAQVEQYFRKAKSLIPKWNNNSNLISVSETYLNRMIKDIKDVVEAFDKPKTVKAKSQQVQPVTSTKMPRNVIVNVKFLDGHRESGKFKKYEELIASGKCIIVD